MGLRSDRTVALMSIQPEFADLIITGEKRVEFRKTQFRSHISHVIIYSTEPVQRIVGFFEVDDLDMADPQDLWERYAPVSGISQGVFDAYYANCGTGVAIKIGQVFKLKEPLPLSTIEEVLQPPRSFRYLETKLVESLICRATLQTTAPIV